METETGEENRARASRASKDTLFRFYGGGRLILGFIESPTDAAWEKKCQEMKL
jgi:hypothetical protein